MSFQEHLSPDSCFEPILENGLVNGEGGDQLWTGTFICNPGDFLRIDEDDNESERVVLMIILKLDIVSSIDSGDLI